MVDLSQIHWPANYDPASCPVHVRNELDMASTPETVWAWLIRAQLWPTWYSNAANIRFLKGDPPDLALGTQFRWKNSGLTVESKVLEFVPPQRLAWNGHAMGFDGYHAWLIEKTESGCSVLTEEVQRGFFPRLQKALAPRRMERFHQVWLEGLRDKSATGMPTSSS